METLVLSRLNVVPAAWTDCTRARLRATALDPLLVICTGSELGADPELRTPNESEEGLMVTVVFTAAPASSRPAPVDIILTGFPESSVVTLCDAVLTSA